MNVYGSFFHASDFRILGKAILERHLVDIPLAAFFLTKVFWPNRDLSLDHLASLDEDLYNNLLYLKYAEDIDDLGLNFTVNFDVEKNYFNMNCCYIF